MNIEIKHGNLLKAPAEALVNTVNCVGVMGKGIALQFDREFPENTVPYKAACKENTLRPGEILAVTLQLQLDNQLPRYIFNFATKDNWRQPSRIEWIERGLVALVEEVVRTGIKSIAIPPLGCGAGGLKWSQVQPLIVAAFEPLKDVQVLLFPPEGAPSAQEMSAPPKAPKMTTESALMVTLLSRYSLLDLEFSQLELQKLAYLLQQSGHSMPRLHFEQMQYGPAARELYPMLRNWENHWTLGFGDGTRGAREPILLKPDVVAQAEKFLKSNPAPEAQNHLKKVLQLIEGLDTALGLELLASVHWVARHHAPAAINSDVALERVRQWNSHKAAFDPRFVQIAWERLQEYGWLENLRPEWMQGFECSFDQIESVTQWVEARPEIGQLLPSIRRELNALFHESHFHLQLWPNPEDNREELWVEIETHFSATRRITQLEEFDRRFWSERAAKLQGFLGVTLA